MLHVRDHRLAVVGCSTLSFKFIRENEESLKKTIDSLAVLKYDDKRKLLVCICDGMIVGAGNHVATPRIVLELLGISSLNVPDPEPLAFKSLGDGSKQLNCTPSVL